MDHIIQLETDIVTSFSKKKSTVAVFLDIEKAYDSIWIQGLLFKMASMGITGAILAWLKNFVTGRSMCVRIGDQESSHKTISNGVPQGAVISPILFNIMMSDFPMQQQTKTLLFADDVTIYTQVNQPEDAETTLQPALDKIYRWGSKWNFKFAPAKSATVVFTRAYKPGADPLLFLNGHRIMTRSSHKFLGVWFDQKLLWKEHIAHVYQACCKMKNPFKIITTARIGPTTHTLMILFKSLVRSKIDYGLIAYGNASKSNLTQLDVISRAIIRIVLGSRLSTPTEILYAESGTEPIGTRRRWLATKYIINLGHRPYNPMYTTAKQMQESEITYPARSTPSLRKDLDAMNTIDIQPWPEIPQLPSSYNYPPPSNPAICKTLWFPMSKKKAMECRIETVNLFNTLSHKIPDTTICAYTDGSHEPSKNITTCAVYIPRLNVTKSWTLSKHSSIFTAELQAIHQTLRIIYDLTDNPPEILVYCDSSSTIKTIVSNQQSTNEAISLIRETIRSLRSSGTRTTLAWIPSHTGITGNERADALANIESKTPSGERTENPLSPSEKASVARKAWANAHLMEIKRCQKVCIQMKTTLNLTRWHYHKERAVSICLHRPKIWPQLHKRLQPQNRSRSGP
ncbi:uncharacterized protein LOC123469925 [Daphnia magna]|uniref:uncharacterized protein LOC123469925 n=1 Tax=Daphnia magna TaxID=35525 RepID=UPI001E1BD70A|nr:uncharacterized protein LOC123469925 [Daphnia magna]